MKNPIQTVNTKFNVKRRLRGRRISHFGAIDAVKAHPLGAVRFDPDEGGTIMTKLNLNLAPVDGQMRSSAFAHVVQVLVPYQAIEKLELDAQEDAGVTEMTRRRLMAGQGVGLEEEGELTKAMYVHPRSVGGDKQVSKTVRLAYNAAMNHLRKAAYYKADLVDKSSTAILPALLTANVLDRFNGVLEPEQLVDGGINLTGDLPIKGIGIRNEGASASSAFSETGEDADTAMTGWRVVETQVGGFETQLLISEDQSNLGFPDIRADLSGTGEISLRDMMVSKKLDSMARTFAKMVRDDPEHGEEKVARAIYGIRCDFDDDCQVIYDNKFELKPQFHRPTDGPSVNQVTSHFSMDKTFATTVPTSELGCEVITIVMVKPLETLSQQPDPDHTSQYKLINRVEDEIQLDEVNLVRRDLESELTAGQEDTPVFWTGHNRLLHDYTAQGPNTQQTTGVAMKSSMWTYPIPTSVTATNVNYPAEGVDMYPFAIWSGGHAEYTILQVPMISTTKALGPNPVERIQLFQDNPELVDGE